MVAAALVAQRAPAAGAALYHRYSKGLIACIFLLLGLSLPRDAMRKAVKRIGVHARCQALSLVAVPGAYYAVVHRRGLDAAVLGPAVARGLMVCLSMPTTTTTGVVFAEGAGGDASVAAVNAALGNLLGPVVSPATVAFLVGTSPASAGEAPLAPSAYPYCDRALPIRARVADLAARFTVNETISQMGTMAAAVPRLGLPALNYGGEALHGVWSTCAAGRCPTQFPRRTRWARRSTATYGAVGAASGLEARALFRWNQRHNASDCARSLEGCLGLTFYAPNVNLARDPRWGRIEEVPSEDPLLNGVYGAEFVRGFQGDGAYRVANAVVKHFAVYNLEVDVEDTADWCGSAACAPPNDRHSFDARVSPRDFEETYVGPFVAPVAAGAAAAMCSYNAVNGEPACTDGALLRGALRGALNFTGVLATDCGALEDAVARHKRYATEAEAAAAAIAAGVDSNCGKVLTSALPEALAAGLVRPDALRPPLERLLEARLRLGLLDDWDADAPVPRPDVDAVDSPAHRALALRAAREGLVLLQNPNQILPLDGRGTLAVIGPNANASMNLLSGYHGTPPPDLLRSPLQELEARWRGGKVVYAVGCNASGAATAALDEAVDLAKTADVVVLGLGLCGDNYGGGPPKEDATCFSIDEAESVDRTSLKLPGAQEALFSKIWALGKPVAVAVFLVSAGAVDASFAKDKAALLLAGYGGEFGGVAVADALLGAYNPGGALTATMLPDAGLPPFRDMAMRPPPPGRDLHGLRRLLAGPTRVPRRAATRFSVVVRNVGAVSGDVVARVAAAGRPDAPLRELFDFARVRDLAPAASTKVSMELRPRSLSSSTRPASARRPRAPASVFRGPRRRHRDITVD
ncbi:symporter [Aureococcus anophagefferens]|nr:symporter [Aureococcus anophagefferens]